MQTWSKGLKTLELNLYKLGKVEGCCWGGVWGKNWGRYSGSL